MARKIYFPPKGFSLVEVALSIAIIASVLLSVLALLPLGMGSNKTSAEAMRAANILTELESDLRNSSPSSSSGKSQIFGLPLPYALAPSGLVVRNAALTTGTSGLVPIDLSEAESAPTPTQLARYRAWIIYTAVPPAASLATTQARLIVTWPALPNPSIADLTNTTRVKGFVETTVTFPAP